MSDIAYPFKAKGKRQKAIVKRVLSDAARE